MNDYVIYSLLLVCLRCYCTCVEAWKKGENDNAYSHCHTTNGKGCIGKNKVNVK